MLSDEEKKAIDYIKNCLDEEYDFKNATRQKDKECYNIILNLIEKLSKEIEELKEKIKTFKIEDENIYLQFGEITEKKRWEDKIKAKVKEIKDRPVQDEFITATQGKLNTIIEMESLLEKE